MLYSMGMATAVYLQGRGAGHPSLHSTHAPGTPQALGMDRASPAPMKPVYSKPTLVPVPASDSEDGRC